MAARISGYAGASHAVGPVGPNSGLLNPFPFATDDHQRKNAEAFERVGAGRMILQKDLTPRRLADELLQLIDQPKEIGEMEE